MVIGRMADVDVIVPTFGRRAHLAEAVGSVMAQEASGWRLIVQENGPGDEWVRNHLAPFVDDPRFSHVVTGEVLPQPESWTRAITTGDSPLVAVLHDDDRWDPPFLRRRMEFLDAHPECGWVLSGHYEIDGHSALIRERPYRLPAGVVSPEALATELYGFNFIQPPVPVVRRAAYREVGARFDPAAGPFIDYEMWLRLAVRYPAGFLHVRDCAFRVHDGSLTAKRPPLGEFYLAWTRRMEAIIAAGLPALELDESLRRRKRAYAGVKAALDALEARDRPRAIAHLRAAVRVYPRAAFDPRVPVALAVAATGERGLETLDRARAFAARRELNLHIRGKPI